MCTKSRKTGVILVVLLDLVLQGYFRYIGFGVTNRGVSFGLGQEWGLIISVVALFIFVSIYLSSRAKRGDPEGMDCHSSSTRFAMTMIVIGGVGNVLARLIWGNVWDYVCIPLLPFCFNLSDALISLGVVSYILRVDGNRSTFRGQGNIGNQ